MPHLTLVLGRRPMQVYDLDQPTVRIGRDAGMDITIDNPGVSRAQAELRREGNGWVVADLGSSNGTFLNGKRITAPVALKAGDEIGIGKFSILFEKTLPVAPAPAQGSRPDAAGGQEGTMHLKAHEVSQLLSEASRKRRAHIEWQSGDQKGSLDLTEVSVALFGTDDLCDVRVPIGPKHHLLLIRKDGRYEVRNLATLKRMRVGGAVLRKTLLKDGDTVAMAGLELRFVAEL